MITPEQRELRKKYIGSSDAAAVLGLDPYRSQADVWLEKTGRVIDADKGNANTERGNLLEPVVLAWDTPNCGTAFAAGVMRIHANGACAANFDGISHPAFGIIQEAKTTVLSEEWGDQGTDQVPDRVLVQVHMAMACAGPEYRLARVPVLMPGYRSFDFRLYLVERNDDLAEMVANAGREFMERYVRTDTPPENFRPSIEILRRLRRVPNKTVEIPAIAVALLLGSQSKLKAAKEEHEQMQADVIAAMGDAEAATCRLGTLTYYETQRKGFTVEPCNFRTLRVKRSKEQSNDTDSGNSEVARTGNTIGEGNSHAQGHAGAVQALDHDGAAQAPDGRPHD